MITTAIVYDHRAKANDEGPGPIEVRVTRDRKTYYINTGIRVLRKNFVGGSIVNQIDALELSERLHIIFRKVQDEVNKYFDAGQEPDIPSIRKKAWAAGEAANPNSRILLDWMAEQVKLLGHKAGTMKHYSTLLDRLEKFGRFRRWQDLTTEHICLWDAWLHKLEKPQSDAEKKSGEPVRYIGDGAVYNYHKCLKALINRAVLFELVDKNPYDRLKGRFKRGDRERVEYLTEEEMRNFEQLNPPKNTPMAVAHDLFVFQMYTGLSYSDMQAFDMADYKCVNGKWVNTGERIKTGVPYVSQLLPGAVKVLEKYGWQVPKMTNQEYNRCLKPLGEVACISTPLHTHLARHTFATYMLRNGAKIQNVSKMLGHTNIGQTQRYAKVMAQSVYDDFDMIANKLSDESV